MPPRHVAPLCLPNYLLDRAGATHHCHGRAAILLSKGNAVAA